MSYPTTLHLIGGKGGDEFSFTGENNGASLEKISVWVGDWQVKAVKVWLSDGRVKTFGKETKQSPQEYTFQPGECFISLSLWGNGAGTRLGAIKFKTSEGREFFPKMTHWGLNITEYPIDVGSGYCLGVEGRSGDDIDRMGFVFLNAVQSIVLTNVDYPTINQLTPEVGPEEIKSVTYRNDSSVTQKQKVETSKKIISKSSWSVTPSLSATFSVEVNAKIPFFAEGKTGFSATVGIKGTYSQEHGEEKNETMSTEVNVPPGKKLHVVISIIRANLDMPYIGTMKITCKNGRVLEYETKGTYKGVAYADMKVDTKESDLDLTDKTDCPCHTHVR